MKIIITSNKPILTQEGRLPKGVPIDVAEGLGQFLIGRGEASLIEVKASVIDPSPPDEKSRFRAKGKKAD